MMTDDARAALDAALPCLSPKWCAEKPNDACTMHQARAAVWPIIKKQVSLTIDAREHYMRMRRTAAGLEAKLAAAEAERERLRNALLHVPHVHESRMEFCETCQYCQACAK